MKLLYQSIGILFLCLPIVASSTNSNPSLSTFSSNQKPVSGTLKQLYEVALSNSPAIYREKSNYYSALEQVKQAHTTYYPKASANVGLIYSSLKEQRRNTAGIALTQPIFNPNMANISHIRKSADIQKQSIQISEKKLIVDLIKAWINALIAQETYALSTADVKTNKSLYNRAQQSFNIGSGRKIDAAEAEGAYRLSIANQIQREAELHFAKYNFSNVVGLPVTTIPVWHNNDQKVNLATWENFENKLANNLNVKQANNKVELARLKTKAAKAKMFPTVQAQLTYQYSKFRETNVTTKPLQLTLSATWEFFSGGATKSEITQNQYLFNAAQASLQETYNSQRVRSLNLWTKLTSAKKKLPALESQLQAKSIALESYKQAYELGTETLPNLLAAQRSQQQAELNLIQTKYSIWLTFIEFKFILNQVTLEDLS